MHKPEHSAGHIDERPRGQENTLTLRAIAAGYRRGRGEKMLRRLMSWWFLVTRAQTLGARAAAFDSSGRVFLVRHTYVAGWHLPGGGVDIGETCHDAMVREIREEGNLQLGDPAELFGIYQNRNSAMRDHVALYVCRNVVQTEDHGGDAEIAASGFFHAGELPADTTPATRNRLFEIAGDIPQSLTW